MSVLTHETPTHNSELRAKAAAENFPVALGVLGRRRREDLSAVYGFARVVDDAGDEGESDPLRRLAELDRLEAELDASFAGTATDPVFSQLSLTIERCRLERQPFVDLIEANRLDQVQSAYSSFEDLLGYCRLSANPVGRLVLGVFGETGARKEALSDLVCSGLQVIEHLQDVHEDAVRGRVYLPEEDLSRFKVARELLSAPPAGTAPGAFTRLMAYEVTRARSMLEEGSALVAELDGLEAAIAVAGFVGGGCAQLEVIERAGYDVLHRRLKATKPAVARFALGVFVSRRGLRSRR